MDHDWPVCMSAIVDEDWMQEVAFLVEKYLFEAFEEKLRTESAGEKANFSNALIQIPKGAKHQIAAEILVGRNLLVQGNSQDHPPQSYGAFRITLAGIQVAEKRTERLKDLKQEYQQYWSQLRDDDIRRRMAALQRKDVAKAT